MASLSMCGRVSVCALVALLCVSAWCSQAFASADPSVTILMTADNEGKVERCWSCSDEQGWGGLARRATLVAKLRKENRSLLLVDAGNALFGLESFASRGEAIVSAYNLLRYDAVNLTYRDFRLGKSATLKLLDASGFEVVSANLRDSATNKLLAQPYIVKKTGRDRIAIIGLTERPPGLDRIPHLKQQLTGIEIRPPLEAMAEWLPKATKQADKVVLLYYGSPLGAARIRKQFGDKLAAILVGGVRHEHLPPGTRPPLVGTSDHGRQLALIRFEGTADKARVTIDHTPVVSQLEPDPEMVKLLAGYLKPTPAPKLGASAEAESGPTAMLPTALILNQTYPLYAVHSNRAVRLTINDAAITDKYGAQSPREGWNFLVMSTEWENIIPLTLVADREMPTKYLISNLADHLYLVLDGQRLCRLGADAGSLAGHVPVTSFALERMGSTLQGNIVFELPPSRIARLELRFYDYAHGHMTIPLKRPSQAAESVEEKPVVSPQANEFLEMGIYGMTTAKELDGEEAADGMEFVLLDVRARSLFTFPADATAFDPVAAEGDVMNIGTVADWKESRKYLHLLADGEYAYGADEHTVLDEEPRFLPDVMTGNWVVFLAPTDARSLELRCDFPNAQTPDTGRVIQPEPLTFLLKGKPPAPVERKPIVSISDDVIDVAVVGQEVTDEFAGEEADQDTKFLVIEVSVQSTGEKGEFFQVEKQLQYACENGEQLEIEQLTYQGIRRPSEVVWIPKGQRRTFQVVFSIPETETKPRLAYRGYSLAKVVELAPIKQ